MAPEKVTFNDEGLTPAPFPDSLPVADLKTLSFRKLWERDPEQSRQIFEIAKAEGFFYVDLLDHPEGVQIYADACDAARVAQQTFPRFTIQEKETFKPKDRVGVYDRGYAQMS